MSSGVDRILNESAEVPWTKGTLWWSMSVGTQIFCNCFSKLGWWLSNSKSASKLHSGGLLCRDQNKRPPAMTHVNCDWPEMYNIIYICNIQVFIAKLGPKWPLRYPSHFEKTGACHAATTKNRSCNTERVFNTIYLCLWSSFDELLCLRLIENCLSAEKTVPGFTQSSPIFTCNQLTNWQMDKLTNGQMDKLTSWQVDKVTKWQSDKVTKWQFDKVTKWQSDKVTKWQSDKVTKWQSDKVTKWQSDKVTKWQSDKVTKWQSDKVTKWQSDKVTKWQSDKVTKWQSDKVTKWQSDKVTKWQSDKQQRQQQQQQQQHLPRADVPNPSSFHAWDLHSKWKYMCCLSSFHIIVFHFCCMISFPCHGNFRYHVVCPLQFWDVFFFFFFA